VVYDEDGEYVATVYPAQGLRETTWIETSCAGGRLRGVAETVQQPTLSVDIEVEGNLVPAAVAGHFTFPQPEGCAGARKNYTYAIDNPDPEPDTPTELIAVTAVPHDGLFHVRWKGTGPVFDEFGNMRTDVALDASDEEPERWVRDETIYVKCLDGPVEDGVVHIEDLEPSDRKLKAQMARPTALLVQGYDIEKPLVGFAERSLWSLGYGREKIDHTGGPSGADATQELMDKIAENRFDIFVVNAHGHSDASNFFVVCSEVDIPELPWVPLKDHIPVADCVYPDEIKLYNTKKYRLFYASSCGLGKGDDGARWREAFGNVGRGIDGDPEGPAEACITWDEVVMDLLCYVFDKAFWESLIAENPADRKDNAADAFRAARDKASASYFWDNPSTGIIARPKLLGDTSLERLRFSHELPIPGFEIPEYP
jgi:hypothetical protein